MNIPAVTVQGRHVDPVAVLPIYIQIFWLSALFTYACTTSFALMLFIYHYDNICISKAQYIGILCHYSDTFSSLIKSQLYIYSRKSSVRRKQRLLLISRYDICIRHKSQADVN